MGEHLQLKLSIENRWTLIWFTWSGLVEWDVLGNSDFSNFFCPTSTSGYTPIINPLQQSSTCPQNSHTLNRGAQITKSWRSLHPGGSNEVDTPWFHWTTIACGRQRVLFSNAFGLPNPMLQGERAEQKIKAAKDSAMFTELTTNMKNKKQYMKKTKQLLLTMMILIPLRKYFLASNSVNPIWINMEHTACVGLHRIS